MKDWSATHGLTTRMTVGQRYTLEADPKKYGDDYGGVILSCGCFHVYEYESDDPSDKIGGSGQPITVYVPVGGQTALWSTKRYNAMARAVGGLPIIEIPTRVGDIASYPSQHQRLDGTSIPDDDKVFPEPPQYQVSDVGDVSWFLSVSETEFNTTAETTTIGMKATLGAFGASGSVEANVGFGTRTPSTRQGGAVSQVPPLPTTPKPRTREAYPTVLYVVQRDTRGRRREDAGVYVLTIGRPASAQRRAGADEGEQPTSVSTKEDHGSQARRVRDALATLRNPGGPTGSTCTRDPESPLHVGASRRYYTSTPGRPFDSTLRN